VCILIILVSILNFGYKSFYVCLNSYIYYCVYIHCPNHAVAHHSSDYPNQILFIIVYISIVQIMQLPTILQIIGFTNY
jgi:hypothetical protein